MTVDPLITNLMVFVLAIFVGYHVVGAMLAAGPAEADWGVWVGAVAVVLAAVNVFGGFLVTQRMLAMFKKKEPKKLEAK